MSDDLPDPLVGMWERIESLLAHERELWDAGIDAPAWYPKRLGDDDTA